MLDHEFINKGFQFIPANFYLNNKNYSSLIDIKNIFHHALQEDDGYRKRAYLKLEWEPMTSTLCIAKNQSYFQTADFNYADGNKVRQFKTMDPQVLQIAIVENILAKNLAIIKDCPLLQTEEKLTIGLHFIRYQASQNGACYSSPEWLHKDDEPLVFVHLIHLSKEALGGDNLIADNENKKIKHVLRLENDIDTLVLNKNVYHAVTPLGSRQGIASRDVILFTVEPAYTQSAN